MVDNLGVINMWTIESIQHFLKQFKINTDGAINPYVTSEPVLVDDGDLYYRIDFPFWSQNESVMAGVLTLCNAALEKRGRGMHVGIYLHKVNTVTIDFYVSVCDPD